MYGFGSKMSLPAFPSVPRIPARLEIMTWPRYHEGITNEEVCVPKSLAAAVFTLPLLQEILRPTRLLPLKLPPYSFETLATVMFFQHPGHGTKFGRVMG